MRMRVVFTKGGEFSVDVDEYTITRNAFTKQLEGLRWMRADDAEAVHYIRIDEIGAILDDGHVPAPTACTCPDVDVSTGFGPPETVKGLDYTCPEHGATVTAPAAPCESCAEVDELVTLRNHSAMLSTVALKIAEMLGEVHKEGDSTYVNPLEQVERLAAAVALQAQALANANLELAQLRERPFPRS